MAKLKVPGGRPPKFGKAMGPSLGLRLPADLIEKIDRAASKRRRTRIEEIRLRLTEAFQPAPGRKVSQPIFEFRLTSKTACAIICELPDGRKVGCSLHLLTLFEKFAADASDADLSGFADALDTAAQFCREKLHLSDMESQVRRAVSGPRYSALPPRV